MRHFYCTKSHVESLLKGVSVMKQIIARTSQSTGTRTAVFDCRDDNCESHWQAVCLSHGWSQGAQTRAAAAICIAHTDDWCVGCMDEWPVHGIRRCAFCEGYGLIACGDDDDDCPVCQGQGYTHVHIDQIQ